MVNLKPKIYVSFLALAFLSGCSGDDKSSSSCKPNVTSTTTFENRLDGDSPVGGSENGRYRFIMADSENGGALTSNIVEIKDGRTLDLSTDEMDDDSEVDSSETFVEVDPDGKSITIIEEGSHIDLPLQPVHNKNVYSRMDSSVDPADALEIVMSDKMLKEYGLGKINSTENVKICSQQTKMYLMGGVHGPSSKSILAQLTLQAQVKDLKAFVAGLKLRDDTSADTSNEQSEEMSEDVDPQASSLKPTQGHKKRNFAKP